LITITRCKVKTLRSILRRATLGIRHRSSIPPLVLHAEGTRLRARYQHDSVAVEYVEPGSYGPLDSIPVPLDVLGDIEGRDDSPVVFEAAEPDKTDIRWQDHGIPQVRECAVTPFGNIAPFPETPTAWTQAPADLLAAFAEASEICTDDSTRYALNCMQLRGTLHKIVATDGHQLLVRSGFTFPWDGDLLIKGSPIFSCKALNRDQPVQIGKTDGHLVLRIGPWTIWNEIQKDARFPGVEEAIPSADTTMTRLQLDAEDSRFLEEALDRLPGNEELNSPATLDLNGRVAILARGSDQPQITELVLDRSSYAGPAICINTNRNCLKRAIQLGFSEIGIWDVESPVVCREPHRVYAWQPLSADAAIEPTGNVIRIGSHPEPIITNSITTNIESPRRSMNAPIQSNGQESAAPANSNGHPASENPGTSLATLIQNAEALHATLNDARSSIARLIAGLRRHRKQSRLVSETLKSLRQLKLTDTAE
jgi:hypothetical protein